MRIFAVVLCSVNKKTYSISTIAYTNSSVKMYYLQYNRQKMYLLIFLSHRALAIFDFLYYYVEKLMKA